MKRPKYRLVGVMVAQLSFSALLACGNDELGDCKIEVARELVYSKSGLVATKGQALVHDSCGQASFCHSSGAGGDKRQGVPGGMNFDMLAKPHGVKKVISMRESIWQQVLDGEMPPKDWQVGDGEWLYDVQRRPGATKLAPLSTWEGKSALRNWLACGAPSVGDTKVPDWALPRSEEDDPLAAQWTSTHSALREGCVAAGCHDGRPNTALKTAGLTPVPFVDGECGVYRWLMYNRTSCDEKFVIGGNTADSALVRVLEGERASCRDPELPAHNDPVAKDKLAKVRANVMTWIEGGAYAPQCEPWSMNGERVAMDAGATPTAPSWDRVYDAIIKPSCATAGCHNARSASSAGGLNLDEKCNARTALLAPSQSCGPRVVPMQPAASLLMDLISNRMPKCSEPMPPDNPLATAQVAQIREWIAAGAQTSSTCM